jgi:Uma2 family endonuclease
MATTLHLTGSFDPPLIVPLGVQSFEAFRAWTLDDNFPEKGRIDYIKGRIDVDMSPEKFISHGKLKSAFLLPVNYRIDYDDLGHLVIDQSRVVHAGVELSAEPDFVFVSYEAIDSGRVVLTESKRDPDDYVEIVGAPDLVCEIVSDSSVKKDTVDLLAAYYEAGIQEYWLADARRGKTEFAIYHRGVSGYEATPADADGYIRSEVLGNSYRLTRSKDRSGMAKFRVEER